MGSWRVGVDSGGTFTDVCLLEEESGRLAVWKVPSTPEDPSVAISGGAREALDRFAGDSALVVFFGHGTTVATNALIQRRGARIGLITSEGFRDLLEIGRQRRPDLYDLQADKPELLVPRDRRLEVPERILHDGAVLSRPSPEVIEEAARRLAAMGIDALAICFLYSFRDPTHERLVAEIAERQLGDAFVTCSSAVCPEFREFERLSTTVVNAFLGPVIKSYLSQLAPRLADAGIQVEPHITQSNGGTISFETAAELPVRTVLSGPSTGVIGALETARAAAIENIITFDMGGTSTDVSLVEAGRPRTTTEAEVHGYPLKVPMIDIHTVGAGGGSIADVDAGGLLKVGPRSAGAAPGPVCYGLGNEEPTVTDANVVMQVLNPRELLGGRMIIDRDKAVAAIERLAARLGLDALETAAGIVRVVTASMARAIRVISVQRGHDPRDYCLVAFGGAGPLHASRLARELEIPRVLVPRNPGILCALGLLLTDLRHDLSVTRRLRLDDDAQDAVSDAFAGLSQDAAAWFAREGVPAERRRLVASADMRYAGQNYELNVPLQKTDGEVPLTDVLRAGFEAAHQRLYGYTAPEEPIEVMTFRIEAYGLVDKPKLGAAPQAGPDAAAARIGEREVYLPECEGFVACPVYDRERLAPGNRIAGPAVIEQMDSTTLVLPEQDATVDPHLNLILESRTAA
ncbi:hydantoinase/oxoprolinase family protein [Pelagibius sp.]|uniref:hydantoinase/oxoprolinase family protein n=1 Tax=Pelagibius sp. TaxID=1931238 RepID=UPI003B50BAE5